MAITDLTNTVWEFTSLPSYSSTLSSIQNNINFISNGTNYTEIYAITEQNDDVRLGYYGTNWVQVFNGYNSTPWVNNNYKTINIIGGADVTDFALITFLETYATNRTTEYLTNNSEISSIAEAIRTKGGTSSSLTYPTGFVTAINAIPTGATLQSKTVNPSTTLQTVSPDSGYDGLSSVTVNAMPSGSATTPATTITANPNISVSSGGLITAAVVKNQNITPTVTAGYVSSGTAGTVQVSGSNTKQLSAKSSQTYTPTTTQQTISAGQYLTGAQVIEGDTNLVAGNIKSGTSIFGVTGTYTGGASNVIQGTFTTPSTTGAASSFTIPYTGSGYPIALTIYIDGGPYNNTSSGNTTWYNSTQRYAIGVYNMVKSEITTAPTYSTSGTANYGTVQTIYKNSTSVATTYNRTSSMSVNTYTNSSTNATANSTACVRFKGNKTTVSYYVASSSYGLLASTKYAYVAIYSS